MLTNQNPAVRALALLAVAAWLLTTCGCAPPGPRALVRGNQYLAQGRMPEAVAELEKAVALLPRSALAWNALGLAYHGNHQHDQAVKAYRNALVLDHQLTVVRYNLGCLYLEQTNLVAAADELRSYTLLQPGAVEGWLRLGTAQLRSRRLDEAERSFHTALEVHPRHPEALNGLGLIQLQRRRWPEAVSQFNLALATDPPYAPALLNSAIVAHQYLNNRPQALQRYRQYLALTPRPADYEAVSALARALERELSPSPAPGPSHPASPAAAPTPGPAVAPQALAAHRSNAPPTLLAAAPRVAPASPPPRTNVHASATAPSPSKVVSTPPAATNMFASANNTGRSIPASRPPPLPSPTPPKPLEIASVKPPEVEVAQVPPDLVIKPAQDLGRPPQGVNESLASSGRSAEAASSRAGTNQSKRGLLSRLNPFSGKTRAETEADAAAESASRPSVAPEIGPPRPVPRYNYLSPAPPTAGSRVEAEKDFKRGLRSQKSGNRAQAIGEYQAAVRNDPSYYDAYYNLGLAAFENSDVRLSLWAYEIALALRPEAEDARYNFALALKSGGYWLDAVEELKRILADHPGDVRAHLSIANLYAQQLHQPQSARPHYERVLELNPRHTEATRIRYWLSANQ